MFDLHIHDFEVDMTPIFAALGVLEQVLFKLLQHHRVLEDLGQVIYHLSLRLNYLVLLDAIYHDEDQIEILGLQRRHVKLVK
mgnify:CR=1 FL=1